jgi:hypothetical protein
MLPAPQTRFGNHASGFLMVTVLLAGPAVCQDGPASLKVVKAAEPRPYNYARSFRAADGTIYLLGPFKTTDAGRKLEQCTLADPHWGTLLNEGEMNTLFSRKGLFLALKNKVVCAPGGQCTGTMWRSSDELKSFQETAVTVVIPEAGKVDNGKSEEWVGLFFHRAIIELRDGALLAAMYGNFEHDTITPTNPRSKAESKYKLRAFIVRSTDQGNTWRYLSTVAAPDPAVVDDTEGFNEWTIVRLADGRLLGLIRTGHYTPLQASWSSDEGKTWTRTVTPNGLGPGGADPFVILLSDGRLALAYGEIVQPKGSREAYWKDYSMHNWPGAAKTSEADERRRCVLAIDADGSGRSWVSYTVADYGPRSGYATIFEVEPTILVYQADMDLWRVELPPR